MEFLKEKSDFFTSVEKAFDEIDPRWREYRGLIVAGSHEPELVEEKIQRIQWARENGIPFLGICLGAQLSIIEFARNVLGLKGANSLEIDPNTPHPVVTELPELRVGIRPITWENKTFMESHWHNFAFSLSYVKLFEKDWILSFTDKIMEMGQLRNHQFFFITQAHPEYQSSKYAPHWLLKRFIKICRENSKKDIRDTSIG